MLIRVGRERYGTKIAALIISALNAVAPQVCYFITGFEHHNSEGSKQASLYLKLSASLWIFTAIVTSIVTPFATTLQNNQDSVIHSLFAISISEMLRSPVIQALDFGGHIYRHILGPRATDQKIMNRYFQGVSYDLSDRYSNMTNILFLAFYYGTIFPIGFFFASATLCIHYWTGEYFPFKSIILQDEFC